MRVAGLVALLLVAPAWVALAAPNDPPDASIFPALATDALQEARAAFDARANESAARGHFDRLANLSAILAVGAARPLDPDARAAGLDASTRVAGLTQGMDAFLNATRGVPPRGAVPAGRALPIVRATNALLAGLDAWPRDTPGLLSLRENVTTLDRAVRSGVGGPAILLAPVGNATIGAMLGVRIATAPQPLPAVRVLVDGALAAVVTLDRQGEGNASVRVPFDAAQVGPHTLRAEDAAQPGVALGESSFVAGRHPVSLVVAPGASENGFHPRLTLRSAAPAPPAPEDASALAAALAGATVFRYQSGGQEGPYLALAATPRFQGAEPVLFAFPGSALFAPTQASWVPEPPGVFASGGAPPAWLWVALALVALGGGALAVVLARRPRQAPPALVTTLPRAEPTEPEPAGPPADVIEAYARARRVTVSRGLAPASSTAREWGRAIAARLGRPADALVAAYEKARFAGEPPAPAEEARAMSAASEIVEATRA